MRLPNLLSNLFRCKLINDPVPGENLINLPPANTQVLSKLPVGQPPSTVQLDRHGLSDDVIKVIHQCLVEVVRNWDRQSHLK